MSRRDTRPWGPGEDDSTDLPSAESRSWGAEASTDSTSGTAGERAGRPFGGIGWRGRPLDSGSGDLPEDLPDDAADRPLDGPRRRRGQEDPAHPRKSLAALGAAVRIVRDGGGVPHVSAKSERDAWAALGWCMAADGGRGMDLQRRLAQGRAAEVLGPTFVVHDALVRTAGVPRRASLAAARLSGAAHDAISSFAAGVNAAFSDPVDPDVQATRLEPWTIADTLAIEVLRAFATSLRTWPAKAILGRLAAAHGGERMRWIAGEAPSGSTLVSRREPWAAIDLAIAELVAGLPVDAGLDGTAWAIPAPGGCEVGASLLASPDLPGAFYAARLTAPGLDVAGCAPVGVPAFHVGRTRDLAWAGVPAVVDDCDVVLEEVDGIGNCRNPSGWEKISSRHETIRVRGGETVSIEVAETRHGPLVSHLARQLVGVEGNARRPELALHWGAGSVFSSVQAWAGLARARDVGGAMRACEAFERATQPVRLVFADRAGRAGARLAGSVPVREASAAMPLLGWAGEGAWSSVRPARPVPARASVGQPRVLAVCGEGDSPDGGAHPVPRLSRLAEVAAVAPGQVATDDVDPVLAGLLPVLRGALASCEDPAAGELSGLIGEFDGRLRPSDRATAIAIAAVHHFLPCDLFPTATCGPLASYPRTALPAIERILLAPSSPWFPDTQARDRAVASALLRASAWLAHAESNHGRRACGALFRAPSAEPSAAPVEESVGVPGGPPPCGSPSSLATLDWRGPTPPFAVGLAPALRSTCSLADARLLVAATGPARVVDGRSSSRDQFPGFAPGALHAIDVDSPAAGEILDLVSG